jgi:hypothetical protein
MDDFSVSSLSESKNEWCARLLNILTPTINKRFAKEYRGVLSDSDPGAKCW